MRRVELLRQIQDIVREVTGFAGTLISEGTIFEEISGWDSAAQVHMIVAVESRFGVIFDIDELSSLPDMAALLDTLEQKLAPRPQSHTPADS
jgi:acyl carrier protein